MAIPPSSSSRRLGRLGNVDVLLVDNDARLSTLLRQVLVSLGFGAIHTAKNGAEALEILAGTPIDLVITDWDMTPINGIDFLRRVRSGRAGLDRRLPILMLTGRAKRYHVEQARDSGITEFLVKPYTVKTLCDRLLLIIDHPRNFILSEVYAGPCRRRQEVLPPGVDDRRQVIDPSQVIARNDTVTVMRREGADIALVAPDTAIKDKIGMSALALLNPENVHRAQRMIHQSRGEFLHWVAADLTDLTGALNRIETQHEHDQSDLDALEQIALRIKSQAGTFDYNLASQIAESLLDLCQGEVPLQRRKLTAARKHVEALYVVFERYIQGDGGGMGKELLTSLARLSSSLE